MRRKDKEITNPEEIEDLLSSAMVGRLGTCLDSIPYITPVNFVYDKGKIFFHSAPDGRKITNIMSNPKVCFEIDDAKSIIPRQSPCASTTEYKSVIIFGDIKFVTDITEKTYALNKLIEKYARQSPKISLTSEAEKRSNILRTSVLERTLVLVIGVKELSAKQSPVSKKTITDPSKK
ncbi:MAG: pyridoxamine 5'-phosphate oxidase family protein [Candidatus Scalinduaceae bacterium]